MSEASPYVAVTRKEVTMPDAKHVVIVGGGFAGLGCARKLAGRDDIRVTLIDKHNYHQFQPLFYRSPPASSPPPTSPPACASRSTSTTTWPSRWAR
jgi:cation diffusion facilitator CzcD-associated flavoprotein CzcO